MNLRYLTVLMFLRVFLLTGRADDARRFSGKDGTLAVLTQPEIV
jgi:hypothetical protein